MAWYKDLAEWSIQRLGAFLGHGASIRTDEFEVKAATADGVIRLLREIRDMQPRDPVIPMHLVIETRAIRSLKTVAGSILEPSMDGAEPSEDALQKPLNRLATRREYPDRVEGSARPRPYRR